MTGWNGPAGGWGREPQHHGRDDVDTVPQWAVELYNDVRAAQARGERLERALFELDQRLDRFMTDYAQAAHDAEQALAAQHAQIQDLGTQVANLQAQLANAPSVDPAVQAAADELEAAVQALQANAPAPSDNPPASDAPAGGGGDVAVDPSAPAGPTTTDGGDSSASESPASF